MLIENTLSWRTFSFVIISFYFNCKPPNLAHSLFGGRLWVGVRKASSGNHISISFLSRARRALPTTVRGSFLMNAVKVPGQLPGRIYPWHTCPFPSIGWRADMTRGLALRSEMQCEVWRCIKNSAKKSELNLGLWSSTLYKYGDDTVVRGNQRLLIGHAACSSLGTHSRPGISILLYCQFQSISCFNLFFITHLIFLDY